MKRESVLNSKLNKKTYPRTRWDITEWIKVHLVPCKLKVQNLSQAVKKYIQMDHIEELLVTSFEIPRKRHQI